MNTISLDEKQLNSYLFEYRGIEDLYEREQKMRQLLCWVRQNQFLEEHDYEGVIEEELSYIDSVITDEESRSRYPRPNAGMKVVTSFMLAIFKKAGIDLSNTDATKMARAINLISGYSSNSVRKYIREETSFPRTNEDAMKAQALLQELGITEKIIM